MKKYILAGLILLFSLRAEAGDISYSYTFVDGQVLTAAQLETMKSQIANEVNDLDGDNFASNVAITTSGTLTTTGTFDAQGSTNKIGNGGTDTFTLNTPSGITYTPAATWTFTGNQTVSGTWADLGVVTTVDINGGTVDGATIGGASAGAGTFTNITGSGTINFSGATVSDLGSVTTADINGGTLDGVQIGGTTATGELLVNDASDDADGLGDQGTSGQFLQSAGAGVNPAWVFGRGVPTNIQVFTSLSDTWTRPTGVDTVYVKVWGGGGGGYNEGPSGGGGGGGYAEGLISVSGNVTVTVGAGGAANNAGGTSSFVGDSTIQATGGGAGMSVGAGSSSGGVGSGGTINLNGGNGGATLGTGNSNDSGGAGGGSPMGGAGGDGGHPGAPGTRPGGGGGGETEGGSNAGSGAAGLVIVYY